MIHRFLYCDNACLTYTVGKAVVEQVKNICLQNSKLYKSYSISSRKKSFLQVNGYQDLYINIWYIMKSLFFFNSEWSSWSMPRDNKNPFGIMIFLKISFFINYLHVINFFKVFRICSMCLITQGQKCSGQKGSLRKILLLNPL